MEKNSKKRYILLKKLSTLLRGNTSKNNGNFSWFNCLHSFRTKKKKLEAHKRVCKNKGFCNKSMPPEDTKKLEFNQ